MPSSYYHLWSISLEPKQKVTSKLRTAQRTRKHMLGINWKNHKTVRWMAKQTKRLVIVEIITNLKQF